MTLLLSLVGEQPIPNLLPLWQSPQRYSHVQYVASEGTLEIAASIEAAIGRDPQINHIAVLPPLKIEAYDTGKARAVLSAALAQHHLDGRAVQLNITGGTKLMSLAAMQAAFGSAVPLLYVSTEQDSIIRFSADGAEQSKQDIHVNIGVQQYLSAHGLEVSQHPSFNQTKDRPFAPPKSGDVLEQLVEKKIIQSGLFDDVRRNIFIRKQTRGGEVRNELDVCATRNGRLVVCSCKDVKAIDNEDLYELSSLSRREMAGIYCGKVLATTARVSDAQVERARFAGIQLVSASQLDCIDFYFKLAAG